MSYGRLNFKSQSVGVRLRAAREARATPGYFDGPGMDCTGTPLGERLGIAALYAGKGEPDTARIAALLVVSDLPDTAENRAAARAHLAEISRFVQLTVKGELS